MKWLASRSTTVHKMARFVIATAISLGLYVGVTALLYEWLGMAEEIALACAIVLTFVVNFLALRYFIFEEKGDTWPWQKQLAAFFTGTIGFRGAEYVAFLVVHTWLGVHYLIALLAISGLSFFTKFFFYRGFVFERKSPVV